jgi:hypothetical protein
MRTVFCLLAASLAASGCATSSRTAAARPPTADRNPGLLSQPLADPYPSTYKTAAAPTVLIRNATLLTAAGPIVRNGAILLRDGHIVAVGASVDAPPDRRRRCGRPLRDARFDRCPLTRGRLRRAGR